MTAGVVTGRVPEMRAGARAAFSRAPRALVRTSLYLHATIRALVSRFSRSRRPPTPRRRRVQERGSQGFANRAEAHVDRRGDEVRVPRPLEVLSSIPRGLVIGGDIRGLSASSPFASARDGDRARVFPSGHRRGCHMHPRSVCSCERRGYTHARRRRDAATRTARRLTRGNTPRTPH